MKRGPRFRLPGGSSVVLGRDAAENERLARLSGGVLVTPPEGVPGPTAYIPKLVTKEDRALAEGIVKAWSRGTSESDRAPYKVYQLV